MISSEKNWYNIWAKLDNDSSRSVALYLQELGLKEREGVGWGPGSDPNYLKGLIQISFDVGWNLFLAVTGNWIYERLKAIFDRTHKEEINFEVEITDAVGGRRVTIKFNQHTSKVDIKNNTERIK